MPCWDRGRRFLVLRGLPSVGAFVIQRLEPPTVLGAG